LGYPLLFSAPPSIESRGAYGQDAPFLEDGLNIGLKDCLVDLYRLFFNSAIYPLAITASSSPTSLRKLVTMLQHEQKGSPILATFSHRASMRLYRYFVIVGIFFIILAVFSLQGTGSLWGLRPEGVVKPFTNEQQSNNHDQGITGQQGQRKGEFKALVKSDHPIPPKIWQIILPKKAAERASTVNHDMLKETATWLALNPGYT
jgi:hypothetical protein